MPYRRLTSNYTSEEGETFEIQSEFIHYDKGISPREHGLLYVFDQEGKCTEDYLQDTIDICKEDALEVFGVPINSWQEEEPLYCYTSSDHGEEHLFKIKDYGPIFGAQLTIIVQGRLKEHIRFNTLNQGMLDTLERYRVALDSWTKDV